jgi:hypothetical protein
MALWRVVCLQERLAAQRAEAKANPKYRDSFKPQASADDKKAKRKQILSNIGVGPNNPFLSALFQKSWK